MWRDPVYVWNKVSMENMNNLSVWAPFLILEGLQICVSEGSPGFKSLPFLIMNLGAQLSQAWYGGIWFSIRFQFFIQPVSTKEKWKYQKQLRISPRPSPSEKQNKLSSCG